MGFREGRRATVGASGSLSWKPLKVCGLEGLCPLGTAGVLSMEFPDHWLWGWVLRKERLGLPAIDRSGGKMKINKNSILSLGPGC